jgi:hypothetical protein
MTFHKQDRQWIVMLSAAKHLTRRPPRCFAALSMTPLDRFWSFTFIIGSYKSGIGVKKKTSPIGNRNHGLGVLDF